MKALTTALAVIGFSTTISAAAQQPSSAAKPDAGTQARFEALDRNDDRQLSKAEARADASLSARFADMDLNLDGYIAKKGYDAFTARMKEREREAQQ
jgi:hypothetical protein